MPLNFLTIPTNYFKKTGEGMSKTLKNPVKFEDGSRISGFTDDALEKAYGYDKNGQSFVISTKDLAMLQIVPKANNKNATQTENVVRELIDKKQMENQVTQKPRMKMPEEAGLGTGLGPFDALLNSLL